MGFGNLKAFKVEFFQNLIEERKKGGIYKNWEDLINRTINYWEKVENNAFETWVKGGVFRSLVIDDDNLLKHQAAVFRYLSIRKKLTTLNNSLPFLNLKTEVSEERKAIINRREFESLGLYVSYFSHWKELTQKTPQTLSETEESKIYSLSEIFQKIEEYDNQKTLINIYAVIYQIEKKDESNYTLFLQDIRNSFKLNVSLTFYLANQENLVIHNELLFTLRMGIKQGKISSLICEKISSTF